MIEPCTGQKSTETIWPCRNTKKRFRNLVKSSEIRRNSHQMLKSNNQLPGLQVTYRKSTRNHIRNQVCVFEIGRRNQYMTGHSEVYTHASSALPHRNTPPPPPTQFLQCLSPASGIQRTVEVPARVTCVTDIDAWPCSRSRHGRPQCMHNRYHSSWYTARGWFSSRDRCPVWPFPSLPPYDVCSGKIKLLLGRPSKTTFATT